MKIVREKLDNIPNVQQTVAEMPITMADAKVTSRENEEKIDSLMRDTYDLKDGKAKYIDNEDTTREKKNRENKEQIIEKLQLKENNSLQDFRDDCRYILDCIKDAYEAVETYQARELVDDLHATFLDLVEEYEAKYFGLDLKNESLAESLEQNEEDGWGEEIEEICEPLFDKLERLMYEVRNTRRDSYARFGDKVEDLAAYLYELQIDMKDVEDQLRDQQDALQEGIVIRGNFKVSGPQYRGARMPDFNPGAFNECEIPDNMRAKYYDFKEINDSDVSDKEATLEYITQEPYTDEDLEQFIDELDRYLNEVAKKDFTILVHVHDRDEERSDEFSLTIKGE